MVIVRRSLVGLLGTLVGVALLSAQAPQPLTAFEAVSIKPTIGGIISGAGAARVGWDPSGRFVIADGSMSVLVRSAYVDVVDVIGLPPWASSEHYDVEAKPRRPPTAAERPDLLRQLLAERLQFTAHVERQLRDTYALKLVRADGRLGPALRRTPVDCTTFFKLPADEQSKVPPTTNDAPRCGTRFRGPDIQSGGITMEILAKNLSSRAGRVVVDATGLPGDYDLTLQFGDDLSLFTALREQLGLMLEPGQASLPVLIVDRLERPSAN